MPSHATAHIQQSLAALPKSQVDRLTYIDFRLYFLGELRRADIIERFQTGPAGATRDVAMYKQLAPENLEFDSGAKTYRPTSDFAPLFVHDVHRALTALSRGFGEIAGENPGPMVKCQFPAPISQPKADIVAAVSRALNLGKPMKVAYQSNTSGGSSREIVPLGLVDTGVRWHVRAFDRKSSSFRDFVLTRLSKAQVLVDGAIEPEETSEADLQWGRVVEIELVPHPAITRPEIVELDFGMTGGSLKLKLRAANAGYMLRLWSVDCSQERGLRGPEFALCLKDPMVLYGVESAQMAPGWSSDLEASRAVV